jgi:hypothetical protein
MPTCLPASILAASTLMASTVAGKPMQSGLGTDDILCSLGTGPCAEL